MSPQENAKIYCRAMGLDPDEKVRGKMFGESYKLKPRWMWYLGARLQDLYRGQSVPVAPRSATPFTPRLV